MCQSPQQLQRIPTQTSFIWLVIDRGSSSSSSSSSSSNCFSSQKVYISMISCSHHLLEGSANGLMSFLALALQQEFRKKKNYKPILQIWKLHKKTHIKIEVMVT